MNQITYRSDRKLPPTEEILRLYAEGTSIPEIARSYSVGRTAVDNALRREGARVRGTRKVGLRFWPNVDKNGMVPTYAPHLGPCWIWLGSDDGYGYGNFRGAGGQTAKAHRVSYEMAIGSIPDGLQLDHLCRIRRCVNPDHLEPVTRRENILRGAGFAASHARSTHCIRGHEFTEENTLFARNGTRRCKTCRPMYQERRHMG